MCLAALTLEGSKITGDVVAHGKSYSIDEGRFADGEVSFTVRVGATGLVWKYRGKLHDGVIEGTQTGERVDGRRDEAPWKARRLVDDGAAPE